MLVVDYTLEYAEKRYTGQKNANDGEQSRYFLPSLCTTIRPSFL